MTSDPVLSVRELSVAYSRGGAHRLALDSVSLDIGDGEILGVVGESGSGKSTLGAAIVGLLPPNGRVTAGEIHLRGRGDIARLSPQELRTVRGPEVAVIFQDPSTSLNPRLPIGAQLHQVLRAHQPTRSTTRERKQRIVAALEEVGIPSPRDALDRYPHEFSGGMRQRVMVAMALLLRPRLVIADEATSALDVTLEAQILELLLRLRDEHGTALMFVSHDLGVVSQLCDRVSVMYAGRVVEETAGADVLASPRHPYTQALSAAIPTLRSRGQRLATVPGRMPDVSSPLGHCGFASRCLHAQEICRTTMPELYGDGEATTRCFVASPQHAELWPQAPTTADWRPVAATRDRSPVTPITPATAGRSEILPPVGPVRSDAPLMMVEDLGVVFRGGRAGLGRRRAIRAVEGVSLTLQPATVLGIVGESGSGKTTLGHAIAKLLRPTHGRVVFEGTDLVRHSRAQRHGFRRRVQMIFQNPYSSLSPRMRIGEQVTEPYRIHHVAPPARRPVEELLGQVNLPASVAGAFPSQVSGGQARRVGIARALTCEPALVVADEPTSGLDQSAAAATLNLLSDLRDETDLAVVLISHSLPQVITIADEICVMYAGQIVERGTTTEVTTQPAHPYTQALLSLAPDPSPGRRITRRRLMAPGEVPSPDAPPDGCRFHPRCAFARDVCRTTSPPEVTMAGDSHVASCHFAADVAANTLTPTARS